MRCPRKGLAIRRVAALRSALCSLLSLSPLATLQTAARLRHHDRWKCGFHYPLVSAETTRLASSRGGYDRVRSDCIYGEEDTRRRTHEDVVLCCALCYGGGWEGRRALVMNVT